MILYLILCGKEREKDGGIKWSFCLLTGTDKVGGGGGGGELMKNEL